LAICKRISKDFFKRFAKNKQSGANVVQNVKIEESNLIYLEILSIGYIQVTYAHLSKLQTSYIPTPYICFGLCWHQSPKRGDRKGNGLNHFQ
jgi:hypothetical protein